MIGDLCDTDVDGDEIDNLSDNCVYEPNADQADINENGTGDACEGVDGDYGFALQGAGCDSTRGRESSTSLILLCLATLYMLRRRDKRSH